MSISWALVIVFIVSYLVGSINFSKILSWHGWHKNIEKQGSGNPGTMNMLRTYGFKAAIATLALEAIKSGLTAWLCAFILKGYNTPEVTYNMTVFFFSGFALVMGSCFPLLGTIKGGKGVATAFGVFMFSELWYVALALFVVGIILIAVTEYGFLSSMAFIIGVSIATTIYVFVLNISYDWLITLLVWLICILIVVKHRKNFYRLFTHQENKANFKASFMKMFKKKEQITEAPEDKNYENNSKEQTSSKQQNLNNEENANDKK